MQHLSRYSKLIEALHSGILKYFYVHVYFQSIIKIGASAVDSNEFLIHLLNRYGLLLWIRSVRYCVFTPMYKTCSQGGSEISRFF